ncbi:MAG: hypothetical protein PHT88_04535 [Candidatus Moranbacteria bacterium]|nr:hypothetical protein [Candidatus Moranbacteria bacterium]
MKIYEKIFETLWIYVLFMLVFFVYYGYLWMHDGLSAGGYLAVYVACIVAITFIAIVRLFVLTLEARNRLRSVINLRKWIAHQDAEYVYREIEQYAGDKEMQLLVSYVCAGTIKYRPLLRDSILYLYANNADDTILQIFRDRFAPGTIASLDVSLASLLDTYKTVRLEDRDFMEAFLEKVRIALILAQEERQCREVGEYTAGYLYEHSNRDESAVILAARIAIALSCETREKSRLRGRIECFRTSMQQELRAKVDDSLRKLTAKTFHLWRA